MFNSNVTVERGGTSAIDNAFEACAAGEFEIEEGKSIDSPIRPNEESKKAVNWKKVQENKKSGERKQETMTTATIC